MSSILKAVSQTCERSIFSTLSTFTDSKTKGSFPRRHSERFVDPGWEDAGKIEGASRKRKTSASPGNHGVLGVLVRAQSKPPFFRSSEDDRHVFN